MNSFNLKSYLTTNLEIDENEIASLIKNCKTKTIKKDEFVLLKGNHCKETFFVEYGLLRQFSIDDTGKEHTLTFAPEGWFLTDRESSYFNQPSGYFIQAMEESQVVVINEEFVQILSKQIPGFTEFNNKLLHNHIRHLQNRINLLLSASAEKRYLQFVKLYPDILLRVPQTLVASYLGITPESLSRVRRGLAQKNFKT